jgi:hypothetical protein
MTNQNRHAIITKYMIQYCYTCEKALECDTDEKCIACWEAKGLIEKGELQEPLTI